MNKVKLGKMIFSIYSFGENILKLSHLVDMKILFCHYYLFIMEINFSFSLLSGVALYFSIYV